ncbi:hypothetical protein D1BOALGB6SA_2519 [Olavius sp. associated proteobacterium Delta 1]|nr:hypothetical protein D1BOALGB6SA_2519 [Olavius sp. associated proteobacterium Delta 1]
MIFLRECFNKFTMEKEELIFQDCSICKSILIEEFTSI